MSAHAVITPQRPSVEHMAKRLNGQRIVRRHKGQRNASGGESPPPTNRRLGPGDGAPPVTISVGGGGARRGRTERYRRRGQQGHGAEADQTQHRPPRPPPALARQRRCSPLG